MRNMNDFISPKTKRPPNRDPGVLNNGQKTFIYRLLASLFDCNCTSDSHTDHRVVTCAEPQQNGCIYRYFKRLNLRFENILLICFRFCGQNVDENLSTYIIPHFQNGVNIRLFRNIKQPHTRIFRCFYTGGR